MNFHPGQPVWIDYLPDTDCSIEMRQYRCNHGTIMGDSKDYPCIQPPNRVWPVKVDGALIKVAEYLLSPFEPPEREVSIDDCMEMTE